MQKVLKIQPYQNFNNFGLGLKKKLFVCPPEEKLKFWVGRSIFFFLTFKLSRMIRPNKKTSLSQKKSEKS